MLIFTFNPKKHSEFPIYVKIKDNYDLLKYSEMAAIKINFFEWEIETWIKDVKKWIKIQKKNQKYIFFKEGGGKTIGELSFPKK